MTALISFLAGLSLGAALHHLDVRKHQREVADLVERLGAARQAYTVVQQALDEQREAILKVVLPSSQRIAR